MLRGFGSVLLDDRCHQVRLCLQVHVRNLAINDVMRLLMRRPGRFVKDSVCILYPSGEGLVLDCFRLPRCTHSVAPAVAVVAVVAMVAMAAVGR